MGTVDETTGRTCSKRLAMRVVGISPSGYYVSGKTERTSRKRGPKTAICDTELLELICKTIEAIPFHGTGYKKIAARITRELRGKGLSVGKNRIYRLMSQADLLGKAPGGTGSARKHDGQLITAAPNVMWGTDGKKFWTHQDGWCWLFDVADHFNSEIIGFNAVKTGDRFEAYRAVSNAIKYRFGETGENVSHGVTLRMDQGSQYTSDYFTEMARYNGLTVSHSWARSPECNGIIERFHRTIQEQLFDLHDFETLDEAIIRITEFISLYNKEWELERLGYTSPINAFNDFNIANKKCA